MEGGEAEDPYERVEGEEVTEGEMKTIWEMNVPFVERVSIIFFSPDFFFTESINIPILHFFHLPLSYLEQLFSFHKHIFFHLVLLPKPL